ncbi:MAG TPA: hypothetical protein VMB49_10895 [Acidobacteriaceae bacterium]|nr:hypothetical protein [Acidobacteriaceae bacterium]
MANHQPDLQPSKHVNGALAMDLLSRTLLTPGEETIALPLSGFRKQEFDALVTLADSNHVLIRGLGRLVPILQDHGEEEAAEWGAAALTAERARIDKALSFLQAICASLADEGHDVTVIKSLDHWPDLGSDLDLYSSSNPQDVCRLMMIRFGAEIAPRSWGDRLACKWNFLLPGLPEAVEIHMGRLGQTGEQISIPSWLPGRARQALIGNLTFPIPAVPDRLLISVLQRMYRHFYFRLCDMVDVANLAAAGAIDYNILCASAKMAGIWEGTAAYLQMVSSYLKKYRHPGLDLPDFVIETAAGSGEVYFARGFLRVPIVPLSVRLYNTQLSSIVRRRELHSGIRLGLLPWLAAAAVVGQKLTGSDKGIW